MSEIRHNQFKSYLTDAFAPAPVYLIFGEEYLYKSVYHDLVKAIIPEDRRDFSLEELDGTDNNVYEAIERVNTFSLDPGDKVVGFVDTGIFYSKEDTGVLAGGIRTAAAEGALKKAWGLFLKLLSLLDVSFENITAEDRQRLLRIETDSPDNGPEWLDTVINYGREHPASQGTDADAVTALTNAVEKGFAAGNHLIITAENVDKRRKLYKAIKNQGVIIDCSVPAKDTKADRIQQAAALSETMRTVLGAYGKTMTTEAFNTLCDLTGFSLRTVHNSLEKLAVFAADRKTITVDDVTSLLKRTRQDPIYELTGAVFDKNIPGALFLLDSLLSGPEPTHPLQVIAALINQTRKLLIIRDFMDRDGSKTWRLSLPFDAFKRNTLPAIEKYDAGLQADWNPLETLPSDGDSGKKTNKQKQPSSDLMIGPNPANPFPTYKNFEKAGRFSAAELLAAFTATAEADRLLKSSGTDPRIILETLIIHIIRPDLTE